MDYRRVSLASFVAGLMLLPVAMGFLIRAVAGPRINSLASSWMLGRTLGVVAVLLLGASMVTAFLTPPDRTRRVWWAVPATVVLVVALLFGWFVF
jgi:hypothetical protein